MIFYLFFIFLFLFLFSAGLTGKVGRVGQVGFPSFPDWVGHGLSYVGRVGSSTSFFFIFLPASVLDTSVLTDHGSDGFKHGSDWSRS
jgi:hypothetical protein